MKKVIPFPWDFPLSLAIVHNAQYTMEISGLIGMNADIWKLEEWAEAQTRQIMENIKSTLKNVGWNMDNVIKARIFLTSMDDYATMNQVYASYFSKTYPTRFALEVSALPAWACVEIECVAVGEEIIEQK